MEEPIEVRRRKREKYLAIVSAARKGLEVTQSSLANQSPNKEVKDLSETHAAWVKTTISREMVSPRDRAIAKRMSADYPTKVEREAQARKNRQALEELIQLKTLLLTYANDILSNTKEPARKRRRTQLPQNVTWGYAKKILKFLEKNILVRDPHNADKQLISAAQLMLDIQDLAVKAKARPMTNDNNVLQKADNIVMNAGLRKSYPLVSFSYNFTKKGSGYSHSRRVSAQWIKRKFKPNEDGCFTGKQLVLLFVLYMGINHIESDLSMKLERMLIEALGCRDLLLKAHEEHVDRALRFSFTRKEDDPIAQALRKALFDTLSMPKLSSSPLELQPDPRVNETNLNFLISLSKCVNKLETSFSFKKHADHIEHTLNTMEEAYDKHIVQHRGKIVQNGSNKQLEGIAELAPPYPDYLPNSVSRLIRAA